MFAVKEKDADIKLRIREVIEKRGGNASQLARDMDISAPYFGSILNSSDKGVSATLLKSLSKVGININWILTGKGEMNLTAESQRNRALKAENRVADLERDLDRAHYLVQELKSMWKSELLKAQNETHDNIPIK